MFDKQASFSPLDAAKKFWEVPSHESCLMEILSNYSITSYKARAMIRRIYPKIFCILMSMGRLGLLRSVLLHPGVRDHTLPLLKMPTDSTFIEIDLWQRFYEEQWNFCTVKLSHSAALRLPQEYILPVKSREYLDVEGCSIVDKTPSQCALQLFHGRNAEVYYTAELRAFQHLSRHSKWPTAIIRCMGSIQNNDTFGLFLEHADRGNLELYMKQNPPPTTESDMVQVWNKLLQLGDGISALHRVPHEGNGEAKLGWHQDITPSNILVVSGKAISAYDATFKIADFGLSQFSSVPKSPEEIRVWDASGTRIYGAPECWAADFAVNRQGVTQAVDIWSLGCVYSELAVWSAYGYPRLQQFRHEREREVRRLPGSGRLPCFHDGESLLHSVKTMHDAIFQRTNYNALKIVIHWINGMLQVAAPERRLPTADALRQLEDIREREVSLESSTTSTCQISDIDMNRDMTLTVTQEASISNSKLSTAAEEGFHEMTSALQRGELEAAEEIHNWLWDTCPAYRLALQDLQLYLNTLFQAVIEIQRSRDNRYRFKIPRVLTEDERQYIVDYVRYD